MVNDLDSLGLRMPPSEYRIENPQRVLQLDPEHGGHRGSEQAPSDNPQADNPSNQDDAEKEPSVKPLNPIPVVDQGDDTVNLSPEAQQATGQIIAGDKKTSGPPVVPSPPEAHGDAPHVDLIA